MDATPIRTDAALARPLVFDGPGEHGGAVFELVSSITTDLRYRDGVERVPIAALSHDLDEWVGRPVVFDDGEAHDTDAIEADPSIQGDRAAGTVLSARLDMAAGERIMRIAVPRAADAAKARRTHYAVSEAYRAATRPATPAERAQGVDRVQTRRYPLSLALIDYRRGGRAGPRARVRTDGADTMAFSLDEFRAVLDGVPDDDEAAKAMLMGKVAKMGGAAMEVEAPAEPAMDAANPAVKPEELMAMKADAAAQKLRADAAEARLLVIEAGEVAADLKRAKVTCDGFDPAAPTTESMAKARAYRDAAALALLRTDAIDDGPQGSRPSPRIVQPNATATKTTEPLRVF